MRLGEVSNPVTASVRAVSMQKGSDLDLLKQALQGFDVAVEDTGRFMKLICYDTTELAAIKQRLHDRGYVARTGIRENQLIIDSHPWQQRSSQADVKKLIDQLWKALQPCSGPTFNQFLHCVAKARSLRGSTPAERLQAGQQLKSYGSSYVEKAAMVESSGTLGGYTVPPVLAFDLLRSLAEHSFIYERALKVYMTAPEYALPTVHTNSTGSSGVSPFQGGMSFTWGVSEGTTLPETEPQFEQLGLKAQDLIGYSKISNQMLADMTPEGEQLLIELFARAAGWQAEYGFLRGIGADGQQPIGMLNSNACKAIGRAGSTAVANTDVGNMVAAFIPEGWKKGVWACNPTVLAQLEKIANFQVNAGYPAPPGAAGFLHNLPLFPTEKLPALGTFGDLMLFDPSMYVVGVRQEVVVDADPHTAFQNNQTFFRVWLRVAGQPWLDAPVTLADGTTKASSVVALQ